MKKSRPIIVTGISSFVGAHVAAYLTRKGNRVVGTHSRPRSSYSGLEAERLTFVENAGVHLDVLDLSDGASSRKIILDYSPGYWVSHAGWTQNYGNDNYDFDFGHMTEVAPYDGIFNVLAEVGCAGVISTGSSAEYFGGETGCEEGDFRWPSHPYGLVKLAKTIRFQQLSKRYGVPVRVARLFNPFGMLENQERFTSAVAQAFMDGTPLAASDPTIERDFVSVQDVCRCYLALLHDCARDAQFDIFNICGGAPVSLEMLVGQLAHAFGADPGLIQFRQRTARPGEMRTLYGSNEKARARLEWTPEPFGAAVERFAKDYRQWSRAPARPGNKPQPLIRLSRCSISSAAMRKVSSVLHHGFLGMGAETVAFEEELKAYLGGERDVICVGTGTAALQLAAQAIGLGPGDEVLIPTLTFVASFQAISATGARPVACDVRASDGYLDLQDAGRRVTHRTRAIMPVHYAGSALGLPEVYAFARQRGLRVIEDAAHAFGGTYGGRKVGSFGDITCFSFDGIKNITAGEGGAVVTGDPYVAERIRDARLLGVEKDSERRARGERSWDFDVVTQGWRYHMSNLNAALGRTQLTRLDREFAPRRREIAARYRENLGNSRKVQLFDFDWAGMVPHIFPIRVLHGRRDAVRAALLAANIETGIHYKPNHLLSRYAERRLSLPVAELLYSELMTLPMHYELSEREQIRLNKALQKAML